MSIMNSIEAMNRQMYSDKIPLNSDNFEKKYGISSESYKNDQVFYSDLKMIENNQSENLSYLNSLYNTFSKEHMMLSYHFNQNFRERNNQLKLIKNIMLSQKNTDYSKAYESARDIINIMSIESFGDFAKSAFDNIKLLIKKIISAIVTFIKMVSTTIRSKLALTQSSFYEKYLNKFPEALKKNGSETAKYKLYLDYEFISVKERGDNFLKIAKDIEDAINEMNELMKEEKYLEDKFFQLSQQSAIEFIMKKLDDGNTKKFTGNKEDITPKELVNSIFFGDKKAPKAEEHPINKLLTEKSVKILSKDWLMDLNHLTDSSKILNKACDKLLKLIEEQSKLIIKSESSEITEEDKKVSKKIIKDISKARLLISYHQQFIYDFLWMALDYRSTIYNLYKKLMKTKDSNNNENNNS